MAAAIPVRIRVPTLPNSVVLPSLILAIVVVSLQGHTTDALSCSRQDKTPAQEQMFLPNSRRRSKQLFVPNRSRIYRKRARDVVCVVRRPGRSQHRRRVSLRDSKSYKKHLLERVQAPDLPQSSETPDSALRSRPVCFLACVTVAARRLSTHALLLASVKKEEQRSRSWTTKASKKNEEEKDKKKEKTRTTQRRVFSRTADVCRTVQRELGALRSGTDESTMGA